MNLEVMRKTGIGTYETEQLNNTDQVTFTIGDQKMIVSEQSGKFLIEILDPRAKDRVKRRKTPLKLWSRYLASNVGIQQIESVWK